MMPLEFMVAREHRPGENAPPPFHCPPSSRSSGARLASSMTYSRVYDSLCRDSTCQLTVLTLHDLSLHLSPPSLRIPPPPSNTAFPAHSFPPLLSRVLPPLFTASLHLPPSTSLHLAPHARCDCSLRIRLARPRAKRCSAVQPVVASYGLLRAAHRHFAHRRREGATLGKGEASHPPCPPNRHHCRMRSIQLHLPTRCLAPFLPLPSLLPSPASPPPIISSPSQPHAIPSPPFTIPHHVDRALQPPSSSPPLLHLQLHHVVLRALQPPSAS